MSTHNLCFEQKYEKYQILLSENFPFLVVKFSIYLNRHVFVMISCTYANHKIINIYITAKCTQSSQNSLGPWKCVLNMGSSNH